MPVSKHRKSKNKMHSFGERKLNRRRDEAKARTRVSPSDYYDYGLSASLASITTLTDIITRRRKKVETDVSSE